MGEVPNFSGFLDPPPWKEKWGPAVMDNEKWRPAVK